jgi:hypothetical protein
MGLKYCKVLGTAASRNTDWEEASDKLNQLLFSRVAEGRSLRVTANPINLVDLEHLKTWSGKNDYEKRGRKSCILEYRPVHQICFAGWISCWQRSRIDSSRPPQTSERRSSHGFCCNSNLASEWCHRCLSVLTLGCTS